MGHTRATPHRLVDKEKKKLLTRLGTKPTLESLKSSDICTRRILICMAYISSVGREREKDR